MTSSTYTSHSLSPRRQQGRAIFACLCAMVFAWEGLQGLAHLLGA